MELLPKVHTGQPKPPEDLTGAPGDAAPPGVACEGAEAPEPPQVLAGQQAARDRDVMVFEDGAQNEPSQANSGDSQPP